MLQGIASTEPSLPRVGPGWPPRWPPTDDPIGRSGCTCRSSGESRIGGDDPRVRGPAPEIKGSGRPRRSSAGSSAQSGRRQGPSTSRGHPHRLDGTTLRSRSTNSFAARTGGAFVLLPMAQALLALRRTREGSGTAGAPRATTWRSPWRTMSAGGPAHLRRTSRRGPGSPGRGLGAASMQFELLRRAAFARFDGRPSRRGLTVEDPAQTTSADPRVHRTSCSPPSSRGSSGWPTSGSGVRWSGVRSPSH